MCVDERDKMRTWQKRHKQSRTIVYRLHYKEGSLPPSRKENQTLTISFTKQKGQTLNKPLKAGGNVDIHTL